MKDTPSLPFDVVEAAISAIGKTFYFKDGVKQLLTKCGVSGSFFDRYRNETKYAIARHVFSELEQRGCSGYSVGMRIVQELCSIRAIADDKVDKVAAMSALGELRRLSKAARLDDVRTEVAEERRIAQEVTRLETLSQRDIALEACKQRFNELVLSSDVQRRGYALEELLRDLFNAHEIHYRPAFRADAQQTDGAFKFESFDYLVESKWTRDETTLAVLDSFKAKVSRKLASTRGLFISISGFSDDVINEFEKGSERNVILMTGEDLVLILERRFSLTDALDLKTTRAAHEGHVFVPLRDCM